MSKLKTKYFFLLAAGFILAGVRIFKSSPDMAEKILFAAIILMLFLIGGAVIFTTALRKKTVTVPVRKNNRQNRNS